jgi:hypothetical protein
MIWKSTLIILKADSDYIVDQKILQCCKVGYHHSLNKEALFPFGSNGAIV